MVTHSAGLHTISGNLTLGQFPSSNGSYSMSGSASLSVAGAENIGVGGSGTFTQTGGTNSAASIVVGSQPGPTDSYNLEGGNVTLST